MAALATIATTPAPAAAPTPTAVVRKVHRDRNGDITYVEDIPSNLLADAQPHARDLR